MAARNSKAPGIQRLIQYRTACIIWWSMIEIPGMFAIACHLLTANLSFLFLAIFHILILFLFTPRKENIILLLNLNSQELGEIEGNKF